MDFPVFPVGTGLHAFRDDVMIRAPSDPAFDFTSIFSADLIPTTETTPGYLTLDLLGTFASDPTGSYNIGQSASMALVCDQATPGAAISCSKTIGTPSTITPSVPEPASLALLGTALVGFGLYRRRQKTA